MLLRLRSLSTLDLNPCLACDTTQVKLFIVNVVCPGSRSNRLAASSMLYIVSMLRLGDSSGLPSPMDDDSRERMLLCLNVLSSPTEDFTQVGRVGFKQNRGRGEERRHARVQASMGNLGSMQMLRQTDWRSITGIRKAKDVNPLPCYRTFVGAGWWLT